MRTFRRWPVTVVAVAFALPLAVAFAAGAFDQTFLSDYGKLQARPIADKGTDYVYLAPDLIERLAKYDGIMVDEPEVLISANSDYKGAQPQDLAAVSGMMRESLTNRLTAGGYYIVQSPGPRVLYLRLALTDLQLKKKKRKFYQYMPTGFVVSSVVNAFKEMMNKYDILGMAIQGELVDSQSQEVLLAVVAERAGTDGDKPRRMDFDELDAQMQEYGSRLRCFMDNSRVPAAQQIDCIDPAARAAREAQAAPKQ